MEITQKVTKNNNLNSKSKNLQRSYSSESDCVANKFDVNLRLLFNRLCGIVQIPRFWEDVSYLFLGSLDLVHLMME